MSLHEPLEEPTSSEIDPAGEDLELQQPTRRGLSAILGRLLEHVRGIRDLIRAGEAGEASAKCLSLSWWAVRYFFFCSLILVLAMMAFSLLRSIPEALQRAAVIPIAVASLVPAGALMLIFASSLLGMVLGLVGIFLPGDRFEAALSLVLNALFAGAILLLAAISIAAGG